MWGPNDIKLCLHLKQDTRILVADSLEMTSMLGKIEGKRRRG